MKSPAELKARALDIARQLDILAGDIREREGMLQDEQDESAAEAEEWVEESGDLEPELIDNQTEMDNLNEDADAVDKALTYIQHLNLA